MVKHEAMDLLDWRMRQNRKRNVVYFGLNESKPHAMKKAEVCYDLLHEGKSFYCEAVFKNGSGRADIFTWDNWGNANAIEIVYTERIEHSGKWKYPCPVRYINAKEVTEKS